MNEKFWPSARPFCPISAGQDNPFANMVSSVAEKDKKGGYDHKRGARSPRFALRGPFLSLGDQTVVTASYYERRTRIDFRARRRFRPVPLARIEDWPVLSYIASRAQYESVFGQAFHMLDIDLIELRDAIGLPPGRESDVVDSLRRLTGTAITLGNWPNQGGNLRNYAPDFPLIDVKRLHPELYRVSLSDFMTDELYDKQMLRSFGPVSDPFAHRLQAWGQSWVGRDMKTGRQIIKQRDALSRLGPIPPELTGDPWSYLVEAVEKNDVPGFSFEMTEMSLRPAIEVHKLDEPLPPVSVDPGPIGDDDEILLPPWE
ncbi:hypothetical protein [Sphingomonas crocodyli]|uniref:Uncharacterized protein n=1 Tax=Sphingomonas crocodyli TaxID=1979270 RepID=A0A437M7C8_9SPHN|nr:hypothetical protein [Sphingomonas crocodyli]RVT93435.1 hypothetical protein EOD43_06040 [Sphingomonas crocodyli]